MKSKKMAMPKVITNDSVFSGRTIENESVIIGKLKIKLPQSQNFELIEIPEFDAFHYLSHNPTN